MAFRAVSRSMHQESAVRVALASLYAKRHERDVPLDELQRALDDVPAEDVEPTLRDLQARRMAVKTPQGWRPASPPPGNRAGTSMAQFSWLHR